MWTLRIVLTVVVMLGVEPVLADTVSVSREGCERLVQHVPDANVAYQPGVDSRGRAVASADYDGAPAIQLPERFQIPITVDLAARFGVPKRGDANYTGDIQVGLVEVDRKGRATFNGQPLTRQDGYELARLCQATTGG
ncbi:MAG: hypothetical protein ACTSX7_16605 [Alphaproteobacteria bacterium]